MGMNEPMTGNRKNHIRVWKHKEKEDKVWHYPPPPPPPSNRRVPRRMTSKGEGGWVLWRPQGPGDRTGGLQGGARSGTHGGSGDSGGHGGSGDSGGHSGAGCSGGHWGAGSLGCLCGGALFTSKRNLSDLDIRFYLFIGAIKIMTFSPISVDNLSVRCISCLPTYYLSGQWTCQLCCCLCRVRKFLYFIKNILICVLKMNECLTGLERHEADQLMTKFLFLGELYF